MLVGGCLVFLKASKQAKNGGGMETKKEMVRLVFPLCDEE